MSDQVRVQAADGVMTIILDRPEKRNALSSAMIDRIADAVAEAELDAATRVVLLVGSGADFCAGADLAELLASTDNTMDQNERDALRLGEIFLAMRRLPKPVVAAVRGRALAGGAGLATAADIVIASDDASFGYPEIRRGFVPAMVMTMLRRSVGEKRAFEMVATGRVISAAEALQAGLISRVVASAEFDDTVAATVRELAAASPTASALTKELFHALDQRDFGDGILLGARVNAMARSTPDFRAAVQRFLES